MSNLFLWDHVILDETLCTGDSTVFVIQICNESNKRIFCFKNKCPSRWHIFINRWHQGENRYKYSVIFFYKNHIIIPHFKLTSAVFFKYWSWIQTFSTSLKILPTTFSTKSSTDTWLSFVGDKTSFLEHFISSWTGEGTCSDLMALESWCKLFKEVLRLFDLCFRLNCLLVERSEYRDLFGVPLFARLSKTFLNGCLDGVTKATTCQSFISVKLKLLIQWIMSIIEYFKTNTQVWMEILGCVPFILGWSRSGSVIQDPRHLAIGCIPLGLSRSGSVIWDHLDHDAPNNPVRWILVQSGFIGSFPATWSE